MSTDGSRRNPHRSPRPVQKRSLLKMDARGRQVIRFLNILRALENTRRGLTVKELIHDLELECDMRTVYRDLDHLRRAGFSIVEEEARYRVLTPSIKSEPLTDSQALAVLLSADLLAPLSGFGVEREFLILRDSIRARLTPEKRTWVDTQRGRVAVRRQMLHSELPEGTLEEIEEALSVEQVLEIVYASPNKEPKRRLVEPYLLWCHADRPYLVARCRRANDFRNFSLARIREARMLDATFERDPTFESQAYIDKGIGAYHGPSLEVTLRLAPEVAHLTSERRYHTTQVVTQNDDGSAEVRFIAGGLPEIAAWVASFGGKVRVLGPDELRLAVRAIHQAGLNACDATEIQPNGAPLTSDVEGQA